MISLASRLLVVQSLPININPVGAVAVLAGLLSGIASLRDPLVFQDLICKISQHQQHADLVPITPGSIHIFKPNTIDTNDRFNTFPELPDLCTIEVYQRFDNLLQVSFKYNEDTGLMALINHKRKISHIYTLNGTSIDYVVSGKGNHLLHLTRSCAQGF